MQKMTPYEILEHTKEVTEIVKMSLPRHAIFSYIAMNNQDFGEHKIFYEDLEEYFKKDRKIIAPHLKFLEQNTTIKRNYRTCTNKDGRRTPNLMHITICKLDEVKKLTI